MCAMGRVRRRTADGHEVTVTRERKSVERNTSSVGLLSLSHVLIFCLFVSLLLSRYFCYAFLFFFLEHTPGLFRPLSFLWIYPKFVCMCSHTPQLDVFFNQLSSPQVKAACQMLFIGVMEKKYYTNLKRKTLILVCLLMFLLRVAQYCFSVFLLKQAKRADCPGKVGVKRFLQSFFTTTPMSAVV